MTRATLSRAEIRDLFAGLCERMGWDGPSEIARELSVDQSAVSKWMNGTRPIPEAALAAIAHVAGETVGYFTPEDWPGQRRRRDLLVAAREMERVAEELRRQATEATGDEGALSGAGEGDLGDAVRKVRPPAVPDGRRGAEGSLPDAG